MNPITRFHYFMSHLGYMAYAYVYVWHLFRVSSPCLGVRFSLVVVVIYQIGPLNFDFIAVDV